MVFEYLIAFTTLTAYTIGMHFWSDMHEMKVDSRRNHMMVGAVITLAIIAQQVFNLIFAGAITIIIMLILSHFEKKQGHIVFGEGDKEILAWSVPGISIVFGFSFAALFIGLLMVAFLRWPL